MIDMPLRDFEKMGLCNNEKESLLIKDKGDHLI